MKNVVSLAVGILILLSTGYTTGASDLKPQEVPKDKGVFFGQIDFFNSDEKIDGSSAYNRCTVWFENERGDTILKISTDKTSWIFASAPVGKIYLSYVVCNTGFLKGHPELKTRELSFPIVASKPAYFGNLTIRFNYHGTPVLGMFGLVGASVEAATSSGSKDQIAIKVDNQIDQARLEYEKRYAGTGDSAKILEAIIRH